MWIEVMVMTLEQAGEFVANHGLAIFLVVGAFLVLVYGLWKPPSWIHGPFESWISKKLEAIERETRAQEMIAESTKAISQTAEEIREAIRAQDRDLEEICQSSRKSSAWFDAWGDIAKEMFQRHIN
ncbi:hypothetical protein [uncultured Rubinisphaera sp.]|uniref:hypothetical protein n=1 Tax=uncultured Rubinisphaera sp. TaxID=1678686 RepID=UPI0030D978D6|tara:strand:- start:448 stop:825 length:378 start_codon:yes stop_codon:yes gene_type:complete